MEGSFLNYRVCTTKSPERREERRRRREKALPSAEFSIAAREEEKQKTGLKSRCYKRAK